MGMVGTFRLLCMCFVCVFVCESESVVVLSGNGIAFHEPPEIHSEYGWNYRWVL